MSTKYPYSYPEVVTNDSAPRPTNDLSIGYAPPNSPAPTATTQVSSSTVFHNSLFLTKQSLNPSGVHALDVPYSPGLDPEEQRQHAHHQYSNGQFQRPQAPGEESLPAYPVTENNTYIVVQERPKKGTWDRLVDICKSRVGAVWYCFASLVAFVLFILLLVGCASPSTSPFATNVIKLRPTSNRYSSYDGYSSYGDSISYESSYVARNPSTGRVEQPNFILFGFSGHCNVFEITSRGSSSSLFAKQCERQFVAPLFIPPPAEAGKDTISFDGIIDIASVNVIRKVVVAMFFIMMFYALGTFIAVCMGYWKVVYKLWWINLILVIITVALFYFDTYSFWSPISAFGYIFLDSVFDSDISVLGMYLFHVALFTILTANPIVLLIFIILGTFGLVVGFWLFWCFFIAWVGY